MASSMTKLAAILATLSLSLTLALGCTQARTAASPEDFYRGKTVSWIVSSDAGSTSDVITRALGPYLAKELGAAVKVENMGTDEGINYVYGQAPRDGLTLVIKQTEAVIANDAQKAPGVLYETEKFNFIADVSPAGRVFEISPKLPYKTIEQLRQAKGLKGGGTTAKGALATSAAVMFEILGLNGKVITGYKGKQDMLLAMTRGEIDFAVTADFAAVREEKDGYVVNLATVNRERSAALPNLPTIFELGVTVPKELEAAHGFIATGGSAVALPPEVPADRVEYLRKTFQKLSDNKDLQADMEKLTGMARPFNPGKAVQEELAAIKANKGLASQLDSIFAKYQAIQ